MVGNRVITLKLDDDDKIAIDKVLTGAQTAGTQAHWGWNTDADPDAWDRDPNHHGPMVCVADLTCRIRASRSSPARRSTDCQQTRAVLS